MQFFDQQIKFSENSDGLVIERSQFIDPDYLESLRRQREESLNVREGEFMRVASVPVAIIEKWQREGFDFFNASAREIVAKLRMENLDAFITTKKQV